MKDEKIKDLGEDDLIGRIADWAAAGGETKGGRKPPPWARMDVAAAIGDDTAVVRQGPGAPLTALTTDMMVEGVHFLPGHPPEALGAKAAASNLSDLAAVGAWPAWILVSLGLPGEASAEWVEALYEGIRSAIDPYGCLCLGGDCVRSDKIVLNIAAGGVCSPGANLPLRDRARPGQGIYVTGTLGDSGAGLEVLRDPRGKRSRSRPLKKDLDFLVGRHQRPSARVEAGLAVARWCPDAAMMDLSDGLAADLPRLGRASGCGFDVRLAALPVSPALKRAAAVLHKSPGNYALFGGEDYELLFTTSVPPGKWRDKVARAAPGRPLRLTRIGTVMDKEGAIRFLDKKGATISLDGSGFQHFPSF